MINKVTQTQRSSMYFFLLTQYTALKILFQQRRTRTSIFFPLLLGFGEEPDLKGASFQDDQ